MGNMKIFEVLLTQSALQIFVARFASWIFRLRGSESVRVASLRMTNLWWYGKQAFYARDKSPGEPL